MSVRKMRMPLAFLLAIVVLGGCGRTEPAVIPYNPYFIEILERGEVASVQIISRPTGS